ncbi:hypothetical protein A2866_00900 [Candidatus Roizmanbacteria bacterium RIFCSPHIGHO2_01_FULL_39_8]|uniref:Big-1 domain-containing protein n=3 Tax=Candidatus Roizmaniibacteriota TaxID=1752723 RepID=A0A1F7GHR7_9BACT|nr:MAG: hypothetical protein A2866_00900 [Candidatus Roizmanbacteria bacterium RIFCSPHIGHO2_01_FULL_39_8]OGK25743.1 MAG: hypothetical protein A3C28_00215 [Candidatus Roizmanbacteria bacterium RIFCSPHIGHO2_02_FULL_39_9]OGK35618.1 MAG: hypothetical protein A3F60_01495 [Candidatus Roizmanbacteria bacterium RIFCSPHIGHO2_12_FULL_39_8]
MDKKLVALLFLFFVAFGFFSAVTVFNKPITQFTRAKEEILPSASKSKIIGWPLTLKADGQTESTISVFVVSESDKPLTDKSVKLLSTLGQVKEQSVTTDGNGKAEFHLVSTTPGTAEIEAEVDPSIKVTQKVTIQFE